MKIRSFILLLFSAFYLDAYTQNSTFRGFVYDKETGYNQTFETKWKGLIPSLMEAYHEKNYGTLSRWADEFMTVVPCSVCNGGRLNQEALSYQIGGVSIARLKALVTYQQNLWRHLHL